MGRWYYHRKATADASYKLKMSFLRKEGMLSGQVIEKISWTSSRTGKKITVLLLVDVTNEPFAVLMYTLTDRDGNKADYKYAVTLVTTPCNFGGVRYWFACPSCHRRVGALYLLPGDIYFRCRHCNNISYQSQKLSGISLLGATWNQIEKLRSEIKRWTWRGRPTRKVRKLQALERKAGILSPQAFARIERLKARISKR